MLRNPNPRDGEYCFNYAWALEENGQEEEAVRYYRKAAWNYGYKGAGLKQAAKLSVRRGDTGAARDCVREALTVNGESPELFFPAGFSSAKRGKNAGGGGGDREDAENRSHGLWVIGENWFLQGESGLERLQAVLGKRRTAWLVLMASYLELGAWGGGAEARGEGAFQSHGLLRLRLCGGRPWKKGGCGGFPEKRGSGSRLLLPLYGYG